MIFTNIIKILKKSFKILFFHLFLPLFSSEAVVIATRLSENGLCRFQPVFHVDYETKKYTKPTCSVKNCQTQTIPQIKIPSPPSSCTSSESTETSIAPTNISSPPTTYLRPPRRGRRRRGLKKKRKIVEEIVVDKYGTQADTLKFGALSINSEKMRNNTGVIA